jgi:SAM-dependent methyltransferase
MNTTAICRQYDELIAPHYDRDPQSITAYSLDRAVNQLEEAGVLHGALPALRVLDLGMGTGMFLERLRARSPRPIEPCGIDISRNMLDEAVKKLPDLAGVVDDAANLDRHFTGEEFDLVSTHFLTGFVPLDHLAPRIWQKLKPGGCWSFVGGTAQAYPALQKVANNPLLRLMFGGQRVRFDDMILPASTDDALAGFERHRYEVLCSDTFTPALRFGDFDEFMDFAFHGGWLTPFLEQIGLQKAGKGMRTLLNKMVFPMQDAHNIAMAVLQKPHHADSP